MMHCPSCRHALVAEERCGQTVDRCRSCGGLWLDATELGALVRQTPLPAHTDPAHTDPARYTGTRGLACPRCQVALEPFNYAHDSGVHINRCGDCDGIWLEHGQLELLVQYRTGTAATQALADAWSSELQGDQRRQLVRQLLHSKLLSGIVAAVQVVGQFVVIGDQFSTLALLVALLFPLICIWFADALGNLTGFALYKPGPRITRTTPGDFVAVGGWLLLLARFVASPLLRG